MNEQFKPVWLEALTSGNYPQGKNQLRHVDMLDGELNTVEVKPIDYCCLGVAADLCTKNKELVNLDVHWDEEVLYIDQEGYEGADTSIVCLPRPLADALGMTQEGELPFYARSRFHKGGDIQDPTYYSLAQANDDGCTFDQIADLIKYFL